MTRRVRATRALENAARRWGFHRVAGCDEVGRGCLAGPVVAAAVVLDPQSHIPGLADSKMLTASVRDHFYEVITARALAWAVAASSPSAIDALNIHRASLDAMRRAVLALAPQPDLVLVDAFRIPHLLVPQCAVKAGDRRCAAIAAASIIAKVTRDREMMVHDEIDPRYGYARHKGYATAAHLEAVSRHGYSSIHRRSFRPSRLFDTMDKRLMG
jgi:ribonuclease HII